MNVIYTPKGKALEYSDLALNLYRGCDHGCTYCYAPAAIRMNREEFSNNAKPRDILKKIEQDAAYLEKTGNDKSILMCFTCDPYQRIDEKYQITRSAIKILHAHNQKITILTKGGYRSERDFDLLAKNPDLSTYATTLTFTNESGRLKYEPFAAPTKERIEMLEKAHNLGIKTWVSCEPVIKPDQTLKLIVYSSEFVDLYKVGKANYIHESKEIDWYLFAKMVVDVLEGLNKDYIIKEDLKRYLI
jgi:DNA repair photolyase